MVSIANGILLIVGKLGLDNVSIKDHSVFFSLRMVENMARKLWMVISSLLKPIRRMPFKSAIAEIH